MKLHIKFIYLNLLMIYFILFVINKNRNKIIKDKTLNYRSYVTLNNKYTINDKDFNSIINEYKRSSIIWPLPKKIKFKPMMTKKELIAFSYFMKPENVYFEFGSGGSTNLASFYKVKTFSVESDIKWHEKLKKSGIKANYITIDLKVDNFGYPGNNTNLEDWKKYIQAYKHEYNANVIFIDGRFRVACALDLFSKINNNTIVLIHDYETRKEYHIIEKFYIKVKNWDNLSLFFKNPKVNSIPENLYNSFLNKKAL